MSSVLTDFSRAKYLLQKQKKRKDSKSPCSTVDKDKWYLWKRQQKVQIPRTLEGENKNWKKEGKKERRKKGGGGEVKRIHHTDLKFQLL